jgi:hypothetical protein
MPSVFVTYLIALPLDKHSQRSGFQIVASARVVEQTWNALGLTRRIYESDPHHAGRNSGKLKLDLLMMSIHQ